jgi:hypothetical protein
MTDGPAKHTHYDIHELRSWIEVHRKSAVWLVDRLKSAEGNGVLATADFADTLRDMREYPGAYREVDPSDVEWVISAIGKSIQVHVWY